MLMRTMFLLVMLLVFLACCAGVIVLQVFLSKKENKWLGLILPIISFGISLLVVLGILFFTATTTSTPMLMVNGEIVEQAVTVTQRVSTGAIIAYSLFIFLLWNIPTGVLLAIYSACRSKQNKQRALEKMSVQDLE